MEQRTISHRLLPVAAICAMTLAATFDNTHAQDCAAFIDHESRVAGETWPGTGSFMFREDGIPIFGEIYQDGDGSRMIACAIGPSPRVGFGSGLVLLHQEACARYDIRPLGLAVSQVRFEALSLRQLINLGVNGYPVLVLPLDAIDGTSPAPGVRVTAEVTVLPDGSTMADVTVMGSVDFLVFGGDQSALDNLCVIGSEMPDWDCDVMADHESLTVGMTWGDEGSELPGLLAFVEDGVEARLLAYDPLFGPLPELFGSATVESAILPSLDRRHLRLEDIGVEYSVAALGRTVRRVTINYFEPMPGLHREILRVNGVRFEGQLADFGALAIPDVEVTVSTAHGDGMDWGVIRLEGDVRTLSIASGDLHVDNVCFHLGSVASAGSDHVMSLPASIEVFPNPCNPQAEIRFQADRGAPVAVSIHDLAGRRLRTLIDGQISDGEPQSVVWNGRNGEGREAAAGLYIVRIRSGEQIATRKVAVIK